MADEEIRWSSESKKLAALKEALVGNVGLATAFISYCGPFNSVFRDHIANNFMIKNLKELNVPYTENIYIKLTDFLVDETTVGRWSLDGLPKDNLSIQNGIMVANSDRYPLLIDPQQQGSNWIKNQYENQRQEDEESVVTIVNVNE